MSVADRISEAAEKLNSFKESVDDRHNNTVDILTNISDFIQNDLVGLIDTLTETANDVESLEDRMDELEDEIEKLQEGE